MVLKITIKIDIEHKALVIKLHLIIMIKEIRI